MEFIESHVNNLEYKEQMIEYLSYIEYEKVKLIDRIARLKNRVPEIEIKQLELLAEKIND